MKSDPVLYRRISLAALVLLVAIVITGAAVRLTGSGMGCPTWPNCESGRLVARNETDIHTLIEQGNRFFTGLVSVSVALAVLGSLWRKPRRRDLVFWSCSLVVGVVAQIVLGGITVLVHLSPPFVMAHFLVSAVLVGCATVLHHRAGEPDAGERVATVTDDLRRVIVVIVVAASTVLLTGTIVTGTGPHGGDENVERLGFAISNVARVHAVAVWILLAASVLAAWMAHRGDARPGLQRALQILILVEICQGGIGYTQYFTGVPEGLVILHILGSMVVWIAALAVALRTDEVVVAADREPVLT